MERDRLELNTMPRVVIYEERGIEVRLLVVIDDGGLVGIYLLRML